MSPDGNGGQSAGPCGPCRGTGQVISNLGGQPHTLPCPWCDRTGRFTPGRDAQEHPAERPGS